MRDIADSALSKLFCLAETEILAADDWKTKRLGRFFLTHGPQLPVTAVMFGKDEAYLLGWPIHTSSENRYDPSTIGDIGGRWALITRDYVLPDPLASYSMVYSADQKMVAASSAVIPSEFLEPDEALNSVLKLPESDHWYPFGLTPFSNLRRLLPEHILHLDVFTAIRKPQCYPQALNDTDALKRVADNLRGITKELVSNVPATILATGGSDSRILLSATRGSNVQLLTFVTADSSTDVRVAKQLSALTGYEHKTIEIQRNQTNEQLWFEVVGRCVAGASLRSAQIKLSLDPSRTYLKGIGGEVGRRTNYFRPGDDSRRTLSEEELVRRLNLPVSRILHEAARSWIDGLSGYRNVGELLEVAYRENRIGAWASPQLHGDSIHSLWLFPMNQQSIIHDLRFLGPDLKTARQSPHLIIDQLWPELLTVPINPLSTKAKLIKFARTLRSKATPANRSDQV